MKTRMDERKAPAHSESTSGVQNIVPARISKPPGKQRKIQEDILPSPNYKQIDEAREALEKYVGKKEMNAPGFGQAVALLAAIVAKRSDYFKKNPDRYHTPAERVIMTLKGNEVWTSGNMVDHTEPGSPENIRAREIAGILDDFNYVHALGPSAYRQGADFMEKYVLKK
ncbi:MAG: hypothetical protein WC488_02490 [Candidatus Micrarchaeia archaeon]